MDNSVKSDNIDLLARYLQDRRYQECNYYVADRFIAQCLLEWVLERLQSRLETCLNASSGVCDIWYLDSHSECKMLMDLIYEFSGNPLYDAKLK
jgi:hypothetical protein